MTPTRRTVVTGALAAAATGPALAKRLPTYPWPLGLQLWSVAKELGRDLPGTFAKLAALGYRRAETAGWYGLTPGAFAKTASSAGLTCDGAHVAMGQLMKDIPRAVGEARDAGCGWLVCASPQPSKPLPKGVDWLTGIGLAMSLDDWKHNAEVAARTGDAARDAGINFAWHNHVAEFVPKQGQRGVDILLDATDPKQMALELDIAWATAGGEDPASFIAGHADRVRLIHVKDAVRLPDGKFAPAVVGSGIVEWRPVLAAARSAGVRHAFVEIEAPHRQPVMRELAAARDYLISLR